MFFIGIDIGGTFTDLALVDEGGFLRIYKAETTPHDLAQGVMDAMALAAGDFGLDVRGLLGKTSYFAHGTTAATNAFIQRKGCKTGLITTAGFGDTILITRLLGMTAGMSEEEVLHYSSRGYPEPIVPYQLIKEVRERIDYKGSVVAPLDEAGVTGAVNELKQARVEAVAVCLLWSFKNPAHERRVREMVEQSMPGVPVTLSSELVPIAGEYERTAAVVINAYLSPTISNYLKNLVVQFRELGLKGPALIMTSSGGVLPVKEAGAKAVGLLESGPAGGVIASTYLGNTLGHNNIIATDMGGTSFDVGLIIDGSPILTHRSVVGKYHISVPMIDIASIGTGGGSIARVDGGYLKVGPLSAGAVPGPVCYGKGGAEPTVTDADVALGFIDPDFFLGGRIKLNKKAAEQSIEEKVARPLGITMVEAAAGIRRVSDSQMADLLRKVTLQRGHDPRDFVLFAYGGAGGVHCSAYGSELGAKGIVVPITATVHSAYGAVASDLQYTFDLSDSMRTPPFFDVASKYLDAARITANFQGLEERALRALRENNISDEDIILKRTVGMRFRRQTHELPVPVKAGELTAQDVDGLAGTFERLYEDRYGKESGFREAGIELTTFTLNAIGRTPKPKLRQALSQSADASPALNGQREVYFFQAFVVTMVYDGLKTLAGNVIAGPAIIEYPGTTVVIWPGQKGMVDRYLNVEIKQA